LGQRFRTAVRQDIYRLARLQVDQERTIPVSPLQSEIIDPEDPRTWTAKRTALSELAE
jgi:hypothetical protein